jgi:hypothetical protein
MRQEFRSLKRGLTGHLKIAAAPTALAMMTALTTPFRAQHGPQADRIEHV